MPLMQRSVMKLLALFATASAGAIKGKNGREGDGVIEKICAIDEDYTITEKEDVVALGGMYKNVLRANGIVLASGNKIINARGYKITYHRNLMAREIAACTLEAEDPMERIEKTFEPNERLSRYVMLAKIIHEVSEGRITAANLFCKLAFPSVDQGMRDKTREVLRQLNTEIERQCNLSPAEFVKILTSDSFPQDILVYLLRGRFNDVGAVRARFSELVRIGYVDYDLASVAASKITGLINKLEKPECSEIRKEYGFRDIVLEVLTSQDDSKSAKMLGAIKLLGVTPQRMLEYIKTRNHAFVSPRIMIQCFKQIPREDYDKPGSFENAQLKGFFLETEFAYERCRMLRNEPELLRTMPEEVLCRILFKIYQRENPTGKASAEQPAEVPSAENPAVVPEIEDPTGVPRMEKSTERLSVERPASDPVLPLLLSRSFEGIDGARALRIHLLANDLGDINFFHALLPYVMYSLRQQYGATQMPLTA
ncbi:hypothetical protein PAPHI01_1610 [Pancytospora philotis]|nr:hypothetical protein PAPHI01_1610 [Pancytospora philotis]